MSDMMTFPNTVEEFMEQYKIVDDEKVYTNGADLVPIFRMKQWFEHVSATDINVGSTISRQQAVDVLKELTANGTNRGMISGEDAVHRIEMLPPAQPEQTGCEYCNEDVDDYVKPIEKNGHVFVRFGMNGWELNLKANGWHGSAKIRYCPMCGRDLLAK